MAINAYGQVVGWSGWPVEEGQSARHAFLWTRGSMLDLGTLGGPNSEAFGINSTGHVGHIVGAADVAAADGSYRWVRVPQRDVDEWFDDDMPFSARHAFLWADGLMFDLNQFIAADAGWVLARAQAIDDAGHIVGYGLVNGCQRAFLLSPVSASVVPASEAPAPGVFSIVPGHQQPGSAALDQALAQLSALGVTSLTERARRGELPRAYGRDAEVDQLFANLLERRSVLLLGPSGVGKTAVLYEAIHRMAEGTAPEPLRGKHVVQVSTSRLEASGLNIGGWAQTLQEMVDALMRTPDIYLYIDDIWNLPHAGRYSGSRTSFATHLRPHLEAGQIVLLGESTPDDYSHAGTAGRDIVRGFSLADDPSLMAQVSVVTLQEPEPAVTRELLSWVAMEREIKDRVQMDSTVIDRCITLTRRFLPYEAFPGKAVRLLESMAHAHRPRPNVEDSGPAAGTDALVAITSEMVMQGFAQLTGLPERLFSDVAPLSPDEIRAYFADRVIGQDEAVQAVIDLVTLVKAELTDPGRPLGVLLFVGPTGSGKTFLAKTLAEFLFGSDEKLIRFDMSEYESVHRAGDLSRRVVESLRRQLFSVVVFDEVEKAHPQVLDLFLQAFDEGHLADPEGFTVDLRNAIVILTSNLGSAEARRGSLGFVEQEGRVEWEHARAVEAYFRPELVNRFDNIVVFHPLAIEDMRRIARRELGKALLREGVQRRNILLDFDEDVLAVLLSAGFSEQYGARPLQRAIKEHVLVPLARHIARQPAVTDQLLELRAVGGRVEMRPIALAPTPHQPEAAVIEAEDSVAPRSPRPPERPRGVDEQSRRHLEDAVAELCTRIGAQLASDRFRALEQRASALLLETAQPTFWDDQTHARQVLSVVYHLERTIDRLESLRDRAEALREGLARLPLQRDATALERLARGSETLDQDLALAELELLASDPSGLATHTVVIAVSPMIAPAAAEPGDWPLVLHEMYLTWAEAKGYETETVSDDGSAELLLLVQGPSVAAILQGEAGIHKRQQPTRGSQTQRNGGVEVQLARVDVTPIPDLASEPHQAEGFHLVYLDALPARAAAGRTRRRVEAYHAPSGTRVRLVSTDPRQFAAAFLRARLDAAPPTGTADEIVRVYNLARTQYVRDPRTGQRSGRPREVLRGALDPFLLAYLESANR